MAQSKMPKVQQNSETSATQNRLGFNKCLCKFIQ